MNINKLLAPLATMLTNNERISIPQTAKLFGTDEKSILKALETLVFCFDSIDTRLEFTNNTACLFTDNDLQTLRLNEEESLIFIDALEKFGVCKEDELLQSLIKAKGYFKDDALPKNNISTTQKTGGESFAALLAGACEDIKHPLLEIEYQGNDELAPSKRIVEPYTITTQSGYSYLRCFLHENGEQRSFRFDRIKNVRLLEEHFEPKQWLEETTEPVYAYVKFLQDANIPEWPDSEFVETTKDGCKIMKVKWLGGLWLPKQIAAQLGDAVIIDPPQLKQETHKYVKSLINELGQAKNRKGLQ